MAAVGPEMVAREERVRKSIEDLQKDLVAQKTFLRLEPPPTVTKDLDRGKGIIFDFSAQKESVQGTEKLMASAISAGIKVLQSGKVVSAAHPLMDHSASTHLGFSIKSPASYSAGLFHTSTSGTIIKNAKGERGQVLSQGELLVKRF